MTAEQQTNDCLSIASLLGVIFIIMKMTGTIAWSWPWVLSPVYIGFILNTIMSVTTLFTNRNKKDVKNSFT